MLLLVWANHPRPGLCPHTVARPGLCPHMRLKLTQAPCAQDYGWIKFSHIRRDSRSVGTRARHHVRLLDMRLHCLQPIRRKGTRGTGGHGRDAARHGLREPTVYPTAEAIPPETLHAHAAEPGRPPGNGNSFPHCTASDETSRYANSTRRRRDAKRYWTRQIAVTRHVTHVWYTLNWNIICQRLPWQSAGSGGDHA